MSQIPLAFGWESLNFQINSKHVLGVLQPDSNKSILYPETRISELISNALSQPSTEQSFRKKQKTVIIVPDKTRNCGAGIILPILLDELNRLGVRDLDIKIILANGSHAFHKPDEIDQILGREIINRIEIIEHNCYNSKDLVYLGETKYGTPVNINRHVVSAERLIVVGTAVHHYFAGFGGGPKMINPGCAGYETITKNHALSIDAKTGSIHRNCRAGGLVGNPVQEDIRSSMQFIQTDFIIETILNENGEIIDAVCGDLMTAHEEACKIVDNIFKVPIERQADLVVVSCGGYPKDINFIQAHKSINNAFYAVKEGGVILVLAECRDGIGSETFLDWFQFPDEAEFLDELKTNYKLNGTTALSLKMKTRASKIIFVSKLPQDLVVHLGMTPATSFEAGWSLAQSWLAEGFNCYVIPNGSLTLPTVSEYGI